MKFDGKSVIVTGGGTGIGRGVALAFAAAGAEVLIVGRREDRLQEVKRESSQIEIMVGDVTDVTIGVAAVAKAIERSGRLDALVNNAGRLIPGGSLTSIDQRGIEDNVAINLVGPTFMAKAALDELEKTSGSIVNVSSIVAHTPSASGAYYGATKLALEYLTRSWAQELAPRRIRVNAIAPGPTESEVLSAAGIVSKIDASRFPLGRWGRPEDIAYWVLAFASDEAAWVTGQVLSVDGGIIL